MRANRRSQAAPTGNPQPSIAAVPKLGGCEKLSLVQLTRGTADMRLMHVSDLHLGRELMGVSRQHEQLKLVRELIDVAQEEDVDVTVIAGDVFDNANPQAWAEDAFYDLIDGLSEGGRRAVIVIAGNHDNSTRLAAAGPLAQRTGIWLVGDPDAQPGASGGPGRVSIEPLGAGAALVRSADGVRCMGVVALPFQSEARLAKRTGGEVPDEVEDRDAYAQALAALFAERSARLPAELPRVLVGHLWVKGGEASTSERLYRVGSLVDLAAGMLPEVDYVALGHLHRPQSIPGASCPVVYAGSPIAYSISEVGQDKRAVIATFAPGQPVQLRDRSLRSGRPLEVWSVRSFDEIRKRAEGRDDRPIVALRLTLDGPVARSELDQLHKIPITFIDVQVLGAQVGDAVPDGVALEEELPDGALVRAYVAAQGGGVDEALVGELLTLLDGREIELDGVAS